MNDSFLSRKSPFLLAVILALVLFGLTAQAQTEDTVAVKAKGKALIVALKYTEALPIYEQLAKLTPNDSEVQIYLGSSLLGQAAANTEDAAARRQMRIRARNAFMAAKAAGNTSLFVLGMIEGIPLDGRDPEGFSDNAEANKAIQKAEAYFGSGKLDDAFNAYQEALVLDPRCYYAALFSGDVKTQTNKYDEAEKWYQRAIAINPNMETAYRYSATPLMRQGKFEQARDRYVEAFILAPYDKLAVYGLVQWGEATKTQIGHPKIDIPEIKYDANGKPTTVMNENSLTDGSKAWLAYSLTRDAWHKEKFARTFPNEKQYRHTLQEEAEAIRSVLKMAKEQKLTHPDFDILQKLDNDGALEAFVLLARADQGIAQDHPAYLRAHRDKLKQYVIKYVIRN